MSTDGFFDQPVIDVFSSEVETLVIAVYKATIAGIDRLDKQRRGRLKTRDRDSYPAIDQEAECWNGEVWAMKYHAGNMALVSLDCLFRRWIERNGGFQPIRGSKLTKARLDEIRTARNSIIHHHGMPGFKYSGPEDHEVSEEFLDSVSYPGHEVWQVAVSESAVRGIADEFKSYIELRNAMKGRKHPKK